MAETRIQMRVLVAGTNDTGTHAVGDVITVDEAHAALFALVGFAARLETSPVPPTTASARTAVVRRSRR
jgi:hypothetical protein